MILHGVRSAIRDLYCLAMSGAFDDDDRNRFVSWGDRIDGGMGYRIESGESWIRTNEARRAADLQSAGFSHSPISPFDRL